MARFMVAFLRGLVVVVVVVVEVVVVVVVAVVGFSQHTSNWR